MRQPVSEMDTVENSAASFQEIKLAYFQLSLRFSLAAEEYERAIAIATRKEEAKTRRRKKKKTASSTSLASNTFHELYRLTGEMLGQGAYASVQTCVNIYTEVEYAVKIIDKVPTHSRARVFKEIDLFHHCQVLWYHLPYVHSICFPLSGSSEHHPTH